jgi:hypothetical protein
MGYCMATGHDTGVSMSPQPPQQMDHRSYRPVIKIWRYGDSELFGRRLCSNLRARLASSRDCVSCHLTCHRPPLVLFLPHALTPFARPPPLPSTDSRCPSARSTALPRQRGSTRGRACGAGRHPSSPVLLSGSSVGQRGGISAQTIQLLGSGSSAPAVNSETGPSRALFGAVLLPPWGS